MARFRCRQCGKEYDMLPAGCFCGNSNVAMWEVLPPQTPDKNDAPLSANADWQQPAAPQPPQTADWQRNTPQPPQTANWQQPAPQPPQTANWQQPAPPVPQTAGSGGGKKKNTALIAVIVALVLILLGVCGYFAWQYFSDREPEATTEESTAKKKEKEDTTEEEPGSDEAQTEAPATEAPATEAPATEAPATEAPATAAPTTAAPVTEAPTTEAPDARTLSFYGITITIPNSFRAVSDGDDYKAYELGEELAYIEMEYDSDFTYERFVDEYGSAEQFAEKFSEYVEFSEEGDTTVLSATEKTVSGRKVVLAEFGLDNEQIQIYLIFFDDHLVFLEFYIHDVTDTASVNTLNVAINSAVIE